jgi:hypothetical protein
MLEVSCNSPCGVTTQPCWEFSWIPKWSQGGWLESCRSTQFEKKGDFFTAPWIHPLRKKERFFQMIFGGDFFTQNRFHIFWNRSQTDKMCKYAESVRFENLWVLTQKICECMTWAQIRDQSNFCNHCYKQADRAFGTDSCHEDFLCLFYSGKLCSLFLNCTLLGGLELLQSEPAFKHLV